MLCKDTERQDSCHAAECQELAREDQAALRLLKKFGACCDAARTSPFSLSIPVHFFAHVTDPWVSYWLTRCVDSLDAIQLHRSIDVLFQNIFLSSFEYFRTTRLLFCFYLCLSYVSETKGKKNKTGKNSWSCELPSDMLLTFIDCISLDNP